VLSGGLCGFALACCFFGTSATVLVAGRRDRSLARAAAATATAGCLGLDFVDFGADGSTGASLCATGG